jgi:hypothetical protein
MGGGDLTAIFPRFAREDRGDQTSVSLTSHPFGEECPLRETINFPPGMYY